MVKVSPLGFNTGSRNELLLKFSRALDVQGG